MRIGFSVPIKNIAPDSRIRNCLASLADQDPPAEIVVVGYDPPDPEALAKICVEYGVPYIGLRVYSERPEASWSMGTASNIGIRRLDTDFAFMLGVDLVFSPNFTHVVAEEYEKNPAAFIVCRHREMPETRCLPVIEGFAPQDYPLSWHHQAALGMGMERWREIRGFDERYVGSCMADNDLVRRAKAAGLEVVDVQGRTEVLHQWHGRRENQGLPDMIDLNAPPNGEDWGTTNRTVNHGCYGLAWIEEVAVK